MSTAEERNQKEKDQLGTVGVKCDHGKPIIGLVATEFIVGIADVLTIGAEKYDADNWKRGMDYRRVYSSMQRHLNAWFGGEDVDPETGKSHLYHAGCCLMFLTSYQHHGVGEDNREHKVYEGLEKERIELQEGIETIRIPKELRQDIDEFILSKKLEAPYIEKEDKVDIEKGSGN